MSIWPDVDGTFAIATWTDNRVHRLGPFPFIDVSRCTLWRVCVRVCVVHVSVSACENCARTVCENNACHHALHGRTCLQNLWSYRTGDTAQAVAVYGNRVYAQVVGEQVLRILSRDDGKFISNLP